MRGKVVFIVSETWWLLSSGARFEKWREIREIMKALFEGGKSVEPSTVGARNPRSLTLGQSPFMCQTVETGDTIVSGRTF